MANSKKNNTSQKLLYIIILPMLLLAVVSTFIGYYLTLNAIIDSKENELRSFAYLTTNLLDSEYPGDYSLVGESSYRFMKGDTDITEKYELVDSISDNTSIDLSIIYSDTRILTSVFEKGKGRATGSGLTESTLLAISKSDKGVFYREMNINNEKYFAYYYPLVNSDGNQIGAIEVCESYGALSSAVWKSVLPITGVIIVILVVLILLAISYNASIASAISKLLKFTKDAAAGNDAAELDAAVIRRTDDIGLIGSSVLSMHRSLREMMDKDPLTKLFNRRSANRKLEIIRSHYSENGTPFSISIGDIDYFKKVNDTYGHDAGDEVLKTVAGILEKNMKQVGFVSRWGGEEFLLVFDKMAPHSAYEMLSSILDEIRNTPVVCGDQTIKVTMSFGLACNPEASQDEIISAADANLYEAKEAGRNRIVM